MSLFTGSLWIDERVGLDALIAVVCAVDGDAFAHAQADAVGRAFALIGRDGSARDGDVAATATIAKADARSISAAIGRDGAAPDGDSVAVATMARADARSINAACSRDGTARDGDVAVKAVHARADARSILAASSRQAAATEDGKCAHEASLDSRLISKITIINNVRALKDDGGIAFALANDARRFYVHIAELHGDTWDNGDGIGGFFALARDDVAILGLYAAVAQVYNPTLGQRDRHIAIELARVKLHA